MNKSNKMKREFNIIGLLLCVIIVLTFMYPSFLAFVNKNYQEFINIFSFGFIENCILIASVLVTYLVPAILFAPLLFVSLFENKLGGKTKKINIVGLIFLGIGLYMIGNAISSGFVFMLNSQSMYNIPVNPSITSNFFEVRFTYISYLYIIYPICQEIMFRSLILKSLNRYGNYFSIIISSLIFALIVGRMQTFIPLFFMGCFLSVISLYNDELKTVFYVRLGIEFFIFSEMFFPNSSLFFGIVSLIVYAVSGLFIYINRNRQLVMRDDDNQLYVLKRFFKAPFIILCIILFILLFKFPNVLMEFINPLIEVMG